jgi:hypothetical protein
VVVAKWAWEHILDNSKNIFFIDNESAREALIRSYSPVWTSRELIVLAKVADVRIEANDWYARVPTGANIADDPSRLDFDYLINSGATRLDLKCPELSQIVGVRVMDVLCKGVG